MSNEIREGWEFFDDLAKKAVDPEEREKIIEIHHAYARLFATHDGQIVMKDLQKRYVDRDVLAAYYQDGVNTAINMAERSGQQKLARFLLTMTKTGANYDKKEG